MQTLAMTDHSLIERVGLFVYHLDLLTVSQGNLQEQQANWLVMQTELKSMATWEKMKRITQPETRTFKICISDICIGTPLKLGGWDHLGQIW